MAVDHDSGELVALPVGPELWTRVFAVAPLVLIGTKEPDGGFDFAPKHMAMPLGWEPYYCFVCSPKHATYHNIRSHRQFSVCVPRPEQIVESSLAAGSRDAGGGKPGLGALQATPGRIVDAPVLTGCSLALECELERVVDGFGENSLIVGRVLAATAARDAVRQADADDADLIHQLGLLAYLAPGRIAIVRESTAFPYAADFRI